MLILARTLKVLIFYEAINMSTMRRQGKGSCDLKQRLCQQGGVIHENAPRGNKMIRVHVMNSRHDANWNFSKVPMPIHYFLWNFEVELPRDKINKFTSHVMWLLIYFINGNEYVLFILTMHYRISNKVLGLKDCESVPKSILAIILLLNNI